MVINSWSCRAPGARRNLNICNCSEIFVLRCFLSAQTYSSLSNGGNTLLCQWGWAGCGNVLLFTICFNGFFSDLFHWLLHRNVLVNSVSAQKPAFLQHSTLLSSVFFFWYSTFLLCFFSVAKQQAQKSLSFRTKGLQGLDVAKVYMEWIIPISKSVCWQRESSWEGREQKKKFT